MTGTEHRRSRRDLVRRLALAVLASSLLVAACGDDDTGRDDDPADSTTVAEARPVTTVESELLAVMRFRSFQEGTRALEVTFTLGGVEARLVGWIDHVRHEGYVLSLEDGAAADLVAWGGGAIAVRPVDDGTASTAPPLPLPTAADVAASWQRAPIDPSTSPLHAILVVVLSLASDRPDNALLIQQGGAEHLRTDEVDGVAVTVFSGPRAPDAPDGDSSISYWVDADGLLRRAEARLPNGATARLDLGAATDLVIDLGLGTPPA